ncbi:hypothetical protein niasHT_013820 [Heterodera trifolii]|uniref:Uncharacterized protein n=1 Tax=Heterodera trifolii TaxID=157864 RepID=A0ABD2KTL0_9BILA
MPWADRRDDVGVFDIFADFENSQTAEPEIFDPTSPIPTVAAITARQKAEVQVKSCSFWVIPSPFGPDKMPPDGHS